MSFLLALQFLTSIPVRISAEITPRIMGRAMVWFPVIGLILGGLLALADWALGSILPATVANALLLLLWVALTGALHLDGLMDCCDGLLAARDAEKRLEILRDTHVGAFAVVGVVCLLLLKFTLLLELPTAVRWQALLVIPAVSRAVMVFAARAFPYARPGPGLGQLFRDGLHWSHVLIAAAVALAAAVLVLGWQGLVLSGVALAVTIVLAWLVQRRIPGLTGDVYGMINEIVEAAALLLFVL
jgi:adenosylcobinamide-GDP ribazoletransferase